MKRIFSALFILAAFSSFAQTRSGYSFQTVLNSADTLSQQSKASLKARFDTKYPQGLSDEQFKKAVSQLQPANTTATVVKKIGVDVLSAIADVAISTIPGKRWKEKLLPEVAGKVFGKVAGKEIDYFVNPAEAEKAQKETDKRKMIDLAVQRFAQGGANNISAVRAELEQNASLKETYGADVFDLAEGKYRTLVASNTAVETQKTLDQFRAESLAMQEQYLKSQGQIATGIATLLDVKLSKDKAAENINANFEKNNRQIADLRERVKELQQGNQSAQKELNQIQKLLVINNANLDVLRIATAENTAMIVKVDEHVLEIGKDVKTLKTDVKNIQFKLDWNEMSLDERITALEGHAYDDQFQPPAAKDTLLQSYKAVQLHQQVSKVFSNAYAYGEVSLQAMDQFNIGSPSFRKNFMYAVQAVGVAGAAYEGNYPAAISGALNMMAKKNKPTAEQQMLSQIQDQLNHLEEVMNAQFDAVHQHLNQLDSTMNLRFDRVDKRLAQIAQRLDDMQADNDRNFSFVMDKLEVIDNQVKCTKKLINDNAEEYSKCEVAFEETKAIENMNLPMLRNYFNVYGDCIRKLYSQMQNLSTTTIFDYQDCDNNLLGQTYRNTLKLWMAAAERQGLLSQTDSLYFLQYAPLDICKADSLYLSSGTIHPVLSSGNAFFEKHRLVTTPYKNTEAINTFGTYVMHFLPILELYQSGSDKLMDSLSQVDALKIRSIANPLKKLLKLTDLAIAQNLLMDGNFLMTDAKEILTKETNDKNLVAFFDLLNTNPYFERNMGIYLTTKYYDSLSLAKDRQWAEQNKNRFKDIDGWLTLYSDNNGQLFYNLQTPHAVKYKELSDAKRILNFKLPVPADEFAFHMTGFQTSPATLDLMRLKTALEEKLNEYEKFSTIPVSSKTELDQTDLLYLIAE